MFNKIISFFRQKEAQEKDLQIKKGKPDESLDIGVLAVNMEDVLKKEQDAKKVLDILGIPCSPYSGIPHVEATVLVKALMDEKKFKEISSKLRLKAFW